MYGRVGENLRVNLRHQKDVYDARCKGNTKPYQVGDLVWLEEKAVPRWVHRKFYRPWSGPWRVVKVVSDVTYRIQCEEATPTRERRKTRMIVHFNRLKRYLRRPPQLQPTLPDVERDAGQPTDLNVGERAVLELPWARPQMPCLGIPPQLRMPQLSTVNIISDLRPRRSTRDRRVPAWMGDFLLGKDIDNALSPLGRGVCNVAKRLV